MITRYNASKSKYSNVLSSPESIDVSRNENNDHVPLCSINDVQLRFLVPDDLTEVGNFSNVNFQLFIVKIYAFLGPYIMSRLVSDRLSSILV